MSRLLGLSAALAEWQWHRGGDQKARSRRRQRAREKTRRQPPEVSCDPCGCRAWCPDCDTHCLAGHANSPTRHWCPDGHFWDAPWPDG